MGRRIDCDASVVTTRPNYYITLVADTYNTNNSVIKIIC